MNETKVINRFKLAIKRANRGDISGQDVKAIVEYQLRGYVKEGMDPFSDYELALIAAYMVQFN